MPNLLALLVLTLLFGVMFLASAGGPAPLRVATGATDTPVQQLMARELTDYFGRLFSNPLEIAEQLASAEVVLGTPESNPQISEQIEAGRLVLPEGTNADQGYTLKTIGKSLYIAGQTDVGVLYGLYALLEEYGCYFQLSGERLPEHAAFRLKQLDERHSPVFKYRGLLPWDNFLCGMSGYSIQDWRLLIERATRLKLNLLQLHFYPGIAFFTETVQGQTVNPACIGMPVDTFKTQGAVGEAAFGGVEEFGPRPYVENKGNPRAQAIAVQAMVRRALDIAHEHGWKTCVGFELMYSTAPGFTNTDKPQEGMGGYNSINPLDEHNVELSLDRVRSLFDTYPNSDYYWLWQSEARGYLGRNVGREPGAAELRAKYDYWSGDPNLKGDIDYAYLFREVVERLSPAERARMATGGWSVQHLFPGINADMPPEITFASLNTYDPPSALASQVKDYQVAETGRPSWLIEWWEFDGNQWFPQFRITWQEQMYKQAAEFGVEALTLLGWKLSGVEHNVRYMADFAWDSELTAKAFYKEYCERLYGSEAARLAATYLDYDAFEPTTPGATPGDARHMLLGAGWMSLVIPTLPGTPEGLDSAEWQRVVGMAPGEVCGIAGLEKLLGKDEAAERRFESALSGLDAQGQSWARLFLNRLEFRQGYLRSMIKVNEALLAYDAAGRAEGLDAARVAAWPYAKEALALARQAVETYAEDVRNTGDLGALAQLNEQYFQSVRRFANNLDTDRVPYAVVDWTAFRLRPTLAFDFGGESPWPFRDGRIEQTCTVVDGKPTLRLTIGGEGVQFNSVHLTLGGLDLEQSPFLDFRMRTTSKEPFAFMFEFGDGIWYALNLQGQQSLYGNLDGVRGSITDGQWHRVTWDLKRLVEEQVGPGRTRITNFILGSWEKPAEPVVVEFQDFAFGQRNLLD